MRNVNMTIQNKSPALSFPDDLKELEKVRALTLENWHSSIDDVFDSISQFFQSATSEDAASTAATTCAGRSMRCVRSVGWRCPDVQHRGPRTRPMKQGRPLDGPLIILTVRMGSG